jgi:hypothetical protein
MTEKTTGSETNVSDPAVLLQGMMMRDIMAKTAWDTERFAYIH